MRTLARLVVNLALLIGTVAAIGWVTTLKAYHDASPHMRTGIVIGIAAGAFIVAWIVLSRVIPAKKKTAQRTSYPYAATAKRR